MAAGKNERGISERLGALERELHGLERMLEEDESWRALAAQAARGSGAKQSMLSRLHKALEANPIYQARAKLLDAMALLSEPAKKPEKSAAQPPASRIAAATRGKSARETAPQAPMRSPRSGSAQPPPLPSAGPPPSPNQSAGFDEDLVEEESSYAPAFDVEEAEVRIVTRDSLLPVLEEEPVFDTRAEVSPPSERSLRRRLMAAREPEGFDGEGYAAYSGSIEEASVMIISQEEIAARPVEPEPAPPPVRPTRRRSTIIKRD